MDSRLYEVKLAGHKLFKDLQESLGENSSGKLVNLLDLKDDVLYVWNPLENCLMCLNLKRLEETGDETPYQVINISCLYVKHSFGAYRHMIIPKHAEVMLSYFAAIIVINKCYISYNYL